MAKVFWVTRGEIVVLVGLFGCLWCLENVDAEEATPLIAASLLPANEALLSVPPLSPQAGLKEGFFEEASFSPQEAPFDEAFRWPSGEQIASQFLRSRFILGKRVGSQIFKSNTTFRISSERRFGNYLNDGTIKPESVPKDPELLLEEQIAFGFQAAETTIEFFNSAAMPMVGGVVSGLTEMGQSLYRMDKRLKKRHLHLRYSDGMPTASYRVKF